MKDAATKSVSPDESRALRRELGVAGAVVMGLGSIVGTGVFVSIGVAAGVAGPGVIVAIGIAAAVATCNGLSSAQLAASHPVSGGTYEYGYRYLSPRLGFAAGWMFLCAKSASAATAALGCAGYALHVLGIPHRGAGAAVAAAVAVVAAVTAVASFGLRQSNRVNVAVVSVTIASLVTFVVSGVPTAVDFGAANLVDFTGTAAANGAWRATLEAAALMFVAFTGYGRIATLGEEVREPRVTIPRAVVVTLWASAVLYGAVAVVAVASVGAGALGAAAAAHAAAPLEVAARRFPVPGVHVVVAVGGMTAMLGVLLNLTLGLSRVLLAMGRRGDMPAALARLDASGTTPAAAVVAVGFVVASLVLAGDVKATWSFSAFTVLVYYAITNLAALRLPRGQRRYGRWVAWCGLAASAGLACWVERDAWILGLSVLAAGFAWHWTAARLTSRRRPASAGT